MSRVIYICAVLMLCGFASAQNVYAPVSFCERYAAALFPSQTAANGQAALITAVINRALFGNTTVSPAVVGILNSPLNAPFFNGTRGDATNFYTNAASRTTLIAHLINFFEVAMNCRAVTTTSVLNMKTVHAPMNAGSSGAGYIDQNTWNDFVGNVVNTLESFGVPATSGANSDITYAAALLGQFMKGSAGEICGGPNCLPYTDFGEFTSGTTAAQYSWLAQDGTNKVSIAVNGNVHFNIGSIHNVVQVDSTFSTPVTGGFTSGAVGATMTYTYQFTTAGTYYFYCAAHPTIMKGTIVVGSTSPAASGFNVSLMAVVLSIAAATAAALRF